MRSNRFPKTENHKYYAPLQWLHQQDILDERYQSGVARYSGYTFQGIGWSGGNGISAGFSITAIPDDRTNPSYFVREDGCIRYVNGEPVK